MPPDLPLRDIHLPSPIGWWPPAPGWWLLVFGLPVLAWSLVWLWRFLRRKTVRKLALQELEKIARSDAGTQEKVRRLAILLRRVALSIYPREEVAGLTGGEWLAFLDGPMKGKPFGEGAGRLLLDAPYRREAQGDAEALLALCREWIKRLPRKPGKAPKAAAQAKPTPPPALQEEPAPPKDPERFARPEAREETDV